MRDFLRYFSVLALLALLFAPAAPAQAERLTVRVPANAPPIISDFRSWQGVNGKRRPARHQGMDVAGPAGMPVIAAADGVVVETDVGTCWGPTVVIDHGRGPDGKRLIAAYGHLGRIDVRAGQSVARGARIGRLGNNQRQFRCIGGVRHLHFQLGRQHRSGPKGTYWGHVKYLVDGKRGLNPHLFWAQGPGQVTCFQPGIRYPAGTLTYPAPCR